MSKTRYCIVCGNEFVTDDPEMLFCPKHRIDKSTKSAESSENISISHQDNFQVTPKQSEIPSSTSDWQPGETILETYEVKAILGKGGFGKVYRVHHKNWNIDLAVKRALNMQEDSKQSFIQEAQNWIDLGLHPHIISCYYVRNIDGFPHTFAELAEGGSLHSWIQRNNFNLYEGNKDQILRRILDIAIQFAWGLAFAHQQGLIHQDVKPQNALMMPGGVLKVTDFGLTKAKSALQQNTGESAMGDLLVSGGAYSPFHCSPEQVEHKKLSIATDIWSWAVSILEMFNGGVTWAGGHVANFALDSYLRHTGEDEDIPPMPMELAEILRNCLQVDPKDRPHELSHLADQLINIYSHVMKESYQRQIPKPIELRADSLNNKALSLLDLGNDNDAETCWETALQADSFHLPTTYNYGVRQWRQARISDETLLDQLERTGAAQAGSGAAVYLRSLVHLERGDHETYQQLALELKNILSEDFEYPNLSEQLADNKGTTCLKSLKIGPVTSMSVSRDGRTMAAVCQSDQLGVWDLAKGSMILRSQGYIESELPVVSVSSNGKLIAEGGFNTLRLWNRNGGNAKPFDIYDATPRSLMISPDNKSMVCGFVDGSVYIYDLHTLDFLDEVTYHRADVRAAIFSPDGKLVFSGGDYGKIKVWSISERSQIAEFEGPPVWSLATSWKGEEVFAACRDGNIYHWNIQKKELVHTLKGHREEVRSVALSPEGNMLLSGSQDSTVRAWDAHSGRCLYTAEEHEGVITGVWIQWEGEEGYRAVTASEEDGVRIWRIKDNYPPICTPFLSRPADTQKAVSQASLIADSKKNIRNLLEDSKLEQAKDMLLRARQTPGFENNDELIEFSYEIAGKIGRYGRFIGARKLKSIKDQVDPSDQLAVTSDGKFLVSDAHNTMVWDVTTRSYLHTIRGKPYQQFTPKSFILPPDGKTALLFNLPEDGDNNPNSQIGLWDLESGHTLRSFVHSGSVKDFQINRDGTRVFSLENIEDSHSSLIHIWDSSSGDELASIPCESEGSILQISKNEKFALISHESRDEGHAISLISIDEKRPLHIFKGLGKPILISPNSTQAVAFSQNGLTIIDLLSYQEIGTLQGFDDCPRVTMSSFTNDGRHILGPHRRGIGVWSTETGDLDSVLETPGWEIGINCLKMGCNDGWIFAAGDVDYKRGEIALWQIGSTQPVYIFKGLGTVFSIALFNKDRYLIAPREDQYNILQLDWEHEFPELTDWDPRVQGYLNVFLGQIGGINTWREMLKSDPANAQKWFTNLLQELASHGFGWVREEGVKKRLDEMSSY